MQLTEALHDWANANQTVRERKDYLRNKGDWDYPDSVYETAQRQEAQKAKVLNEVAAAATLEETEQVLADAKQDKADAWEQRKQLEANGGRDYRLSTAEVALSRINGICKDKRWAALPAYEREARTYESRAANLAETAEHWRSNADWREEVEVPGLLRKVQDQRRDAAQAQDEADELFAKAQRLRREARAAIA
jgi:hypothetical protein